MLDMGGRMLRKVNECICLLASTCIFLSTSPSNLGWKVPHSLPLGLLVSIRQTFTPPLSPACVYACIYATPISTSKQYDRFQDSHTLLCCVYHHQPFAPCPPDRTESPSLCLDSEGGEELLKWSYAEECITCISPLFQALLPLSASSPDHDPLPPLPP